MSMIFVTNLFVGEHATGSSLPPECLENDVSRFCVFKLVLNSVLWKKLAVYGVTFVMSWFS